MEVGRTGDGSLREVAGTEHTLDADLVLIAMGFLGPERELPEQFGCKLDHRGNIVADADYMTTVPGVFSAGDCSRGQSLVVWAIHEGREAARGVDGYLKGEFLEDRSQWGSRTAEVASVV